jgi:sugar lactone lactonase YvrE
VYQGRGRRLVREITHKLVSPGAIVIDPRSDHLFVACHRYVVEYGRGGSSPIRTIRVLDATSLAIDQASNLYVGRDTGVAVYPPGSNDPSYVITNGATGATSLAFDHTGNLYVAQFYSEQVSVYAPEATSPSYTLDDVNAPSAMAFDSNDNLYVANEGSSVVQEYAPGANQPTSTITQGLDNPNALAFDSQQNLYVSNLVGNTIAMFNAASHKLRRKITKSVANPIALLFVGSS